MNPTGIILGGSPASIQVEDTPRVPALIWACGVGYCYGMQLMAAMLAAPLPPEKTGVWPGGYHLDTTMCCLTVCCNQRLLDEPQ